MIAAQVPELADGGYWYVVPAVADSESDDPAIANSGAGYHFAGFSAGCAWYGLVGGVMMVAVRSPDPASGIPPASPETVSDVLQAAGVTGKPLGRVGGR